VSLWFSYVAIRSEKWATFLRVGSPARPSWRMGLYKFVFRGIVPGEGAILDPKRRGMF